VVLSSCLNVIITADPWLSYRGCDHFDRFILLKGSIVCFFTGLPCCIIYSAISFTQVHFKNASKIISNIFFSPIFFFFFGFGQDSNTIRLIGQYD
jgi:hypothetical protein